MGFPDLVRENECRLVGKPRGSRQLKSRHAFAPLGGPVSCHARRPREVIGPPLASIGSGQLDRVAKLVERPEDAAFEPSIWTMATPEQFMMGKCPKCEATPNIVVEALRARDESSQRTLPILQFLCDQCKTILSIALDPEWQAQVVAGQLRAVDQGSATSH